MHLVFFCENVHFLWEKWDEEEEEVDGKKKVWKFIFVDKRFRMQKINDQDMNFLIFLLKLCLCMFVFLGASPKLCIWTWRKV